MLPEKKITTIQMPSRAWGRLIFNVKKEAEIHEKEQINSITLP